MKKFSEMIIKRNAERLQAQLESEKERNAELAGYSLLPEDSAVSVQNVPEYSKYKTPNDNTCIGYWEEKTGHAIKDDAIYHCPACGREMSKRDSTLDGAHVFKPGHPNEWYFVPLCSSCNNPENRVTMKVKTKLVPVPPECYELK